MKKNILCAFVALLALLVQARLVSSEEAKLAACAWAERNAAFGVSAADVGEPVSFADANGVTLWHQVQMGTSCLIVSPVTELEPVIAALENVDAAAGLPAGHPMLAMLTCDMADRLQKLGLYSPAGASGGPSLLGAAPSGGDAAPSDPAMAVWAEEGKSKWARLLPTGGVHLLAAREEGVVDIATQISVVKGFEKGGALTHWNQGNVGGRDCYNYYTPNHAVCGCVATMMSAIMQYFAVTGVASDVTGVAYATYNGLQQDENGRQPYTYKTQGGLYDWSIFSNNTDRASYNTLSDEQRELLGRVAYNAGVAIGMAWTDGESGAVTIDVAEAFRTVFGFVDARGISSPTENQYEKLIYNQCRAGAPVGLSIRSEGGGHAVVGVGYGEDEDGVPRVRIFTGWGGGGDGWYALPYITTASVPGGGNFLFDVVSGVITMIGYDTDETVPVVGRVDAPGEAIEMPGVIDTRTTVNEETGEVTTMTSPRTIFADEAGYFGTRVAPSTTDCRLICRGKEAQYAIGSAAKVQEETYIVGGDELCAALPEVIEFTLLNSSVAYTFAKAKEMALAEGKAILRVSGVPGEEATTNLLTYIYVLDKENVGGFTNKFVYFFTSARSSNPDLPDGTPSIGVFLPTVAEQDGRWQYTNGRLSYGYGYSTELDQTEDEEDGETHFTITDEAYVATWGQLGTAQYMTTNLPYTIPDGLTAMAQLVLDGGWDEFCRRTHGITLTVTASAAEVGAPDPMYGVHANTYTNGQDVTAIAPDGLVTNNGKTIIFKYSAWELTVTNTVAGGPLLEAEGTGQEVSFAECFERPLMSNDVVTLTWIAKPKKMWISIADNDDGGVTSPGTGWYDYGETVTFTATPEDGCAFAEWKSAKSEDLPEYLDSFRKQPTLSFRVVEPLDLMADYNWGGVASESFSATAQMLTIVSAEVDDEGTVDLGAPLDDDNLPKTTVTIYPDASSREVDASAEIELSAGTAAEATLAADAFTDEDEIDWKCEGWVLVDEKLSILAQGNGTITSRIVLSKPATLIWIWAAAEDDDDDDEENDDDEESEEEPDPPVGPNNGSPLTIYSNADGTLTVKTDIANAKKGWWYVLLTAETVSGTYAPVAAESEGDVCAKKADEKDEAGTLVLQSTFTPSEEKRFYKVTVQEGQP